MQENLPCPDRRVCVLTSPKAGSGANRDQIPKLRQRLHAEGVECELVESPEELAAFVHHEGEQPTVVVAAGGDGTVSLAATTIRNAANAMIVPMPLGTENLLSRHFGFQADAEQVANTIRHGKLQRIDSGLANGQPFLIMASCGFDAEVVRVVDEQRQGHISKWSYAGPILRAIRTYRFPDLEVRIDGGETIGCRWAMVFNLPSYGGGLKIEPGATVDDGLLDVIVFQGGSVFHGLRYVAGIWMGKHMNYRDVIQRRGKKIEITSDEEVPYQLDGDFGGSLSLSIQTCPGSIALLVPPES